MAAIGVAAVAQPGAGVVEEPDQVLDHDGEVLGLLAAGAGELRDFIVSAWTASASASIGWPAVKVAEVEAGTSDPWIAMVGED